MKVINGENMLLGRVCSMAAKAALLGEEVALVNCEKLMVTGNKRSILERQRIMADKKGKPTKGVFYERRPDFFVRKIIRHMLPPNPRGRQAYKHVKCHVSVPKQFESTEMEAFPFAHVNKVPHLKRLSVADICRSMGGKW